MDEGTLVYDLSRSLSLRHEFESIGPTLFRNPLGAGWGLLPTLQWVGSWLPTYLASLSRQVERRFHYVGIELPTTSFGNGHLSTITW